MALRQALCGLRRSAGAARGFAHDLPRQVTSSTTYYSNAELASVLGDEPAVGKDGSGWGLTPVGEIIKGKGGDRGNWLFCSKDDLVLDAITKMTKANVGSLLVFDASKLSAERLAGAGSSDGGAAVEGDAVEGIITERDYLTKVAVQNRSSKQLRVGEIMTEASKLMTVAPASTTAQAMSLMIKYNFRHVPVVDNGTYLGMVSMRDVVKCLMKEHEEDMARYQEYIQGSY